MPVKLPNCQTSTVPAATAKSIRRMSKPRPLIVNAGVIIPPSSANERTLAPPPATIPGAAGRRDGGALTASGCAGSETRILIAVTSDELDPPPMPMPIPPPRPAVSAMDELRLWLWMFGGAPCQVTASDLLRASSERR